MSQENTSEAVEKEAVQEAAPSESLAEAQAKAAACLANWQRAEADFSNYRKRAEQERGETVQRTTSSLVLDLLPVLDDMERAFVSLPSELVDLTWIEGMQLIYRKLRAIMERQGLSEITAKGQSFDPTVHEAVRYADGEEGVVVAELQKGYRMGDRVLRPALVVVGTGKAKPVKEKKAA